jgi:hypothetical protein
MGFVHFKTTAESLGRLNFAHLFDGAKEQSLKGSNPQQ